MKVYHGSSTVIKTPEILDSQRLLDFGMGFYTTSSKVQAENWAVIKQKRLGKNASAVVTVYEVNEDIFISAKYAVKIFSKANEEWLDFIVANRREYIQHPFDIVKGVVANDTLYSTLSLFEAGVLTKAETITRLKTHKLFDQISFHNHKVISELNYIENYSVSIK
jgi:hypothetical protein